MIDIVSALKSLTPTAQCVIRGDELEWLSPEIPQPSEAEIQAEITRLQTEFDNNKYQRDRAQEYPPIVDQLDDIFHNGIDGWKASIQVVKDKYPKGSN